MKAEDLTGRRFGRLTAMEHLGKGVWLCRCDCGAEKQIRSGALKSGRTASCGCLQRESRERHKDLTGQRFGRLTAICRLEKKTSSGYKWECKCDCGRTSTVSVAALLGGRTKSCGCLQAEISAAQSRPIMVDGTNVGSLKNGTISQNNSTGVRGVSFIPKAGKYRAYITFKKKRYHIGTFLTLEDAKKARQLAEEEYFEKFLEEMEKPAE